MRISEMTESQYSTYLRGVSDGEHNAINACFGGLRSTPAFDSQEEYDLYRQGYDAGYDAIDYDASHHRTNQHQAARRPR